MPKVLHHAVSERYLVFFPPLDNAGCHCGHPAADSNIFGNRTAATNPLFWEKTGGQGICTIVITSLKTGNGQDKTKTVFYSSSLRAPSQPVLPSDIFA
jgi:hypothetical protein